MCYSNILVLKPDLSSKCFIENKQQNIDLLTSSDEYPFIPHRVLAHVSSGYIFLNAPSHSITVLHRYIVYLASYTTDYSLIEINFCIIQVAIYEG